MIFNTPAPEDIVRWYRKGVPGGGQKDRIFDRLKAKLTGGTDDSGTSYFSMLEKKISTQDADIIIKNMKTDIDGYPMFETGSTSGQDERRYQEWIVERYLLKESFTEGFTDTTVTEEEKEEVAEEEAEEIVEKAEEEVKENIDEAVKAVDEVVDKPIVEETAPDLSDIVDLLPPGMLNAVNQQTGQNYEKTPKEKKQKEESVSNSKILKTLTSSLEKIQGQLSSIDNELKKQNELFGAAVGTTVSNLNQIETTYDSLNDRFDDILNAMQSQNETEKEKAEAAEMAASIDNLDDQDDMSDSFGYEDLTDPMKKKKGEGGGFDFGKMFDKFRKFKNRFFKGGPKGGTGTATATGTGATAATGSAVATGTGTTATGGGATATGATGLTAAGIVGSVGLALGAVGEGGFMGGKKLSEDANRIKEIGQNMSDDGNPLGALMGGLGNFSLAQGEGLKKLGTFADVGFAPFRMLASLPLQALGVEKLPGQEDSIRHNDAKFDSRIREDARAWMNKVDFMNIIPDEVGGFGNIYNDENAHKEMMQKFEMGGSGTGVPELHGTEALIGPGFYKDLMSPIGGTILSASSKVLSDVGPLAATVAPSFQQEASKIATAFDVPKSLASTNVGGSIDGVANAINKGTKKIEEEATYDSRAVEGMSEEADGDEEDKGPLGLLKNAFKGLSSLFGGGDYDGDPTPTEFTDLEFGNTDDLRFGLTGTTAMSVGGWSHAHFEAQDKSQSTLMKDVTPVVKKMASQGLEPETSDGRAFTTDMTDSEIAELIKHGASIHNHSGPKPYAVDINMPGFPKVPVQLEDVRNTPFKGEGINALIKGTKTAIFHLSYKTDGYKDGGVAGRSGEEQITVGEEGPEVVMKNLVYSVPPVLNHLLAMNDAGTPSELIQTYRTFVPEVLEYDEEAESMAQTIIVMTPSQAPPEPTMDIPRDKSITKLPTGVASGKSALHIALFA